MFNKSQKVEIDGNPLSLLSSYWRLGWHHENLAL